MAVRQTLRAAFARVAELLGRRRIDAERDEEFQFHLECEIGERIARGETPADARRAALIAFGGIERFREETRSRPPFRRATLTSSIDRLR